jgi:hypothetical protein
VLLHRLQPAIPKMSIVEVLMIVDSTEELNASYFVQANLTAAI